MSTIPQTGSRHHRLNLRAFLAGSGATVALIAGAVIAFLTIGALFAFDDLPFGGGDDGATVVEIGGAAGPEGAAAALAGASRAIASPPTRPTATPAGGTAPRTPGEGSVLGATQLGQDSALSPAIGTGPGSDGAGALGDTIGGAEDEAGNAGADLSLSDLTGDATRSLDDAVGGISGSTPGQPAPGD